MDYTDDTSPSYYQQIYHEQITKICKDWSVRVMPPRYDSSTIEARNYVKCYPYGQLYISKKEENWEPYIEKVIFNPPATIVFWKSGGKTVVKCNEPDEYDKAKGVALCYMKKALMNSSGEFNKQLRKAGVYYTEEDKGE